MKRIIPTEDERRFRRRCVFLDDLEKLLDALTSADFTTALSVGEWEFDTLTEIKEKLGPSLKALRIKAVKRGSAWALVLVVFFSGRVRVSYSGDSETRAFWKQLLELVPPDPRWKIVLHPLGLLWLAAFIGVIPALLLLVEAPRDLLPPWLVPSALLGLYALAAGSWKLTPFVNLDRRHAAVGFWARNWEKVVLLVVGAVVAQGLRALWDYFFARQP